MNDNREVRNFLAQLRKFLPERVIYEALSSLPDDIFDIDNEITVPCLKNDEEIQEFINQNDMENSENLSNFFMKQYMDKFNSIIDEIMEKMAKSEDCLLYDFDYDYDLVFAG